LIKNGAQYIIVVATKKIFSVIVLELELSILFNIINTLPQIDAPKRLGTMSTNTNGYGR
jgi:hypothetical protein